jgi:hypothetical protein
MNKRIFTIKARARFFLAASACLLVFILGGAELLAQYKGAPVKRDRLLRALRSKQLQSTDIVTIINRNGVDFRLTPGTRKALLAAGARPEVIRAVESNLRIEQNSSTTLSAKNRNQNRINKRLKLEYEDLLEEAIYSYKERRNPSGAVQILETAARSKPASPQAYQMMGFVYLYGLNDFAKAEKFMLDSFMNGGSAVFRVFHDDNGKFSDRCTGSLYISQNTMRFESDNNVHTFEASSVNIDKIKLDKVSTKDWKNRSIFKVTLKFGKEEAKFRFAPLTGAQEETRMVERFIGASNPNKNPSASAASH